MLITILADGQDLVVHLQLLKRHPDSHRRVIHHQDRFPDSHRRVIHHRSHPVQVLQDLQVVVLLPQEVPGQVRHQVQVVKEVQVVQGKKYEKHNQNISNSNIASMLYVFTGSKR